jgi:hypothetical protein
VILLLARALKLGYVLPYAERHEYPRLGITRICRWTLLTLLGPIGWYRWSRILTGRAASEALRGRETIWLEVEPTVDAVMRESTHIVFSL